MKCNLKKKSNNSLKTGVLKDKNNKWYAQINIQSGPIKSKLVNSRRNAEKEYEILYNKYMESNKDIGSNDMSEDEDSDNNDEMNDENTDEEDNEDKKDEINNRNYPKRNRKNNIIFEPDTSPTYKYKPRKKKSVYKVKNNIIFKNKVLPRKNFLQLDKDMKLYSQNNKCNICYDDIRLDREFDHIIPRCFGGKDKYINMQYLCSKCHKWKSNYLDRKVIKPMLDDMKGNKSEDFINIINKITEVQRKEYSDHYQSY